MVPALLLLQGRRRPILGRKPKPQPSKPSHPICPSIISSWQSSADLAQLCYGDGGKGKRLFLATHSHPHRRRLALIFRDAQSEDSFVPTNSKRMPEEEGVLVMTLPFVFEERIRRKRTVKRYVRSKESPPPARPSLLISFPSPLFPSSAPPPPFSKQILPPKGKPPLFPPLKMPSFPLRSVNAQGRLNVLSKDEEEGGKENTAPWLTECGDGTYKK